MSNRGTQDAAAGNQRRTGFGAYVNDILLENHTFGIIQRAAQVRRTWIPGLAAITARTMSRKDMTELSDRICSNTRLMRVPDMEYPGPRTEISAAFRAIRA